MYDRERLIGQLLKHEGEVLLPYRCSAGYLTIGVGRNLEQRGITQKESRMLLSNDIEKVHKELAVAIPWMFSLSDDRQLVLMDMAFNLGTVGLLKFRKFLTALEEGDYETAADEMLDSKWAKQVKGRAITLAEMMRNG